MHFRKLALALALLLVTLLAAALFRAARTQSRQVPRESPATEVNAIDTTQAARHLAESIRHRTVSHDDPAQIDTAEFLRFHQYLARTYPRVHATLTRETVRDFSLLYRWDGQDPKAPPAILLGHLDVVPAENSGWTVPPFEGRIDGKGMIWGRGAVDDKVNIIGILEAAEALLSRNSALRPKRTIYFAFGHDEELDGSGAAAIASLLEARGVRPDFLLDEGGLIGVDLLPGVAAPGASVATGEKGYLDVELSVAATGGHSSTPPAHTAAGIVSQAVVALEAHPLPARLAGASRQTLDYAAPEMTFPLRLVMANLWLTSPLVKSIMLAEPTSAAQIRTTAAVTMLEGSPKPNVLPQLARAVVNFRLLPGETIAATLDHVRHSIADPRVAIRTLAGEEAPPVADPAAPPALLLQRALRKIYPDAVFAPVLSTGATDARHYRRLTSNLLRFSPFVATTETFHQMHGVNEQIPAAGFSTAVRFYAQLLLDLAQ